MKFSDREYILAATDIYRESGAVEVDDGAAVSRDEGAGAYVAAWLWVSEDDVSDFLERKKNEEGADRA